MAHVTSEFTLLRRVDITQPTFADPNWVSTQDFVGWQAAGPLSWTPNHIRTAGTGRIEFLVLFENTPSLLVPALPNTRLDLQLVAEQRFRDNRSIPRLVFLGGTRQLAGDTVTAEEQPLFYHELAAVRLISLANPPTATFVDVYGRVV